MELFGNRDIRISQGLAGAFGKSVWGLVDQAIVSAASFLTMVLLARALGPEAFGAFVLVYGVLLFLNALQSGLFTQPHNVLGAGRSGDDYARYTTATLVSQGAFAGMLALGALVAALVAGRAGLQVTGLLLALAPAIPAWQTQEYLRRVLYTEGRVREAVCNDLISYGGQIAGIVLLWQLGRLSGPAALVVLGVTSSAAALVGFWQLRDRFQLGFDRGSVRENWHFGKWLFGANLVQAARLQVFLMLIAALVGVGAAGLYRAALNLVAPTHVIINAMRSIAMPRAAELHRHEGFDAMRRYVFGVALLALAPLAGYVLAVCVLARPALHLLYGGQYDEYAWLVWGFGLGYLMTFLSQLLTLALSAMQVSRSVLIGELTGLATGVTLGVPMMWLFGIGGAMLADLTMGGVIVAALISLYRGATGEGRAGISEMATAVSGLRGNGD